MSGNTHPVQIKELNGFTLLEYLGNRKYRVKSLICGCTIEKYYGNIISCVNGMCNSCRKIQDSLKKKPRNTRRGRIAKHTKTGNTWRAMKSRCYDKNNQDYYLYGEIGVKVCDRWLEIKGEGFRNFLEDMGERPEGTTLNRIKGSLVYSKETCEWATLETQAFDKRKYSDSTKPVGIRWFDGGWTVTFRSKYIKWVKSFKEACSIRAKAEFDYFGKYLQNWEEISKHYEQDNNCS